MRTDGQKRDRHDEANILSHFSQFCECALLNEGTGLIILCVDMAPKTQRWRKGREDEEGDLTVTGSSEGIQKMVEFEKGQS